MGLINCSEMIEGENTTIYLVNKLWNWLIPNNLYSERNGQRCY